MKSKSKIVKVKCCHNCKYYKPEPVQPWEEGLCSYMCYKHDTCTDDDNLCDEYKQKK